MYISQKYEDAYNICCPLAFNYLMCPMFVIHACICECREFSHINKKYVLFLTRCLGFEPLDMELPLLESALPSPQYGTFRRESEFSQAPTRASDTVGKPKKNEKFRQTLYKCNEGIIVTIQTIYTEKKVANSQYQNISNFSKKIIKI